MDDLTPVAVVGAAGRMGRTILECAADGGEGCRAVAAVESPDHPLIGQDLRMILVGAPGGIPVTTEIPDTVPAGTVAIVFAFPDPTMRLVEWAERTGNPIVIGTTGFDDAQLARIRAAGVRTPVILAPNMSVGVNVLCELVARAAGLLGPDFDIEISEMHHRFKKDAPSGTARRLAEVALEARGKSYAADVRHGRHGIIGERTPGELGMHALRGGDVVGDHTVTFAALGERIELTHRAHSRETFARGALRAAHWLAGRPAGLYGMKDVLGL